MTYPRDKGADGTRLTPEERAWPFNTDSPMVADIMAEGGRVRTLLIDVVGLEWPAVEHHLETVLETARQRGLVPVFLTDIADVMPLYRAGLVFDAIPRASAMAVQLPDLDWSGYITRRRRLIDKKWHPAATVRLGPAGTPP